MLASALAAVLLWAGGQFPPAIHPLHSALTEMEYQPESESVIIRIRAFTDDLARAVPPSARSAASDSVLYHYVQATLALTDPSGRPVQLHWLGVERSDDVLLLHLQGKLPGGLRHASVLPTLLWESFPDQVNIVRATYEGHTVTLLFTRGDRARTFP